ncbi:uncharacterized protein PHALS_06953 [Plasmopara halstedii]|uniref:Uncharacterized protein n=1 Tax=Plasmopara halstedii TaxID=4781 RepID=A0A0P1B4D8_PLAHL|nr:uncharacterized protein PHALS_06953 [Plasmopara halstedii]CEG49175.1 hypothetical protein PHALS_06953 [Plasmopara halstedii]|eukprot:XP_024585544.1 hypothetical protein PHALS_06953 [Plasmopara halstedii]
MPPRRHGVKLPMKQLCQLTDSSDDNAQSCDGNKENEANAEKPGRRGARQGGNRSSRRAKKGLSKRQVVDSLSEVVAGQDSPPIFVFKTAKTSFSMRKQRKIVRQQDDVKKHQQRIGELVAYFKMLDEQKLEEA